MSNPDTVYSHDTSNRSEVFDAFRAASPPAVLISPSASFGEDFPDVQARWQAIAKVPYAPLGDPWVKAKMATDPTWYDRQAAQGLIQAAGRVVRGPEDYGITYILDKRFGQLYDRQRFMFPAWFQEALQVPRS